MSTQIKQIHTSQIFANIISYNIKEKFNDHDDGEKPKYLLFNSKFITMLKNFLSKDFKTQKIKNRNIGAEILDLELSNNM